MPDIDKGADRSRHPLNPNREQPYIFFSEHTFFAASHVPPAFSQSAAFFAVVTSPANAGIPNPSASAKANVERSVFMAIGGSGAMPARFRTLSDTRGLLQRTRTIL